jgi:hypothetical protein
VTVYHLLDYECILFHCGLLGSDSRVGHFFSFRYPLVNTPQLNTQLCYDWTGWQLQYNWLARMTSALRMTSYDWLARRVSEWELYYDRRSLGQSVFVSSTQHPARRLPYECLLQPSANRRQNTPLTASSDVICVSVVTGTCVNPTAVKHIVLEMYLPNVTQQWAIPAFRLSDTLVILKTCVDSAITVG